MECPVCYCDKALCKLVCGHSFCKSCVKTWYYKCDEPSCPMCRRALYFKGMHKVVEEWDEERAVKKNEDAFNKAFDEIFFEEDESDTMSINTQEPVDDEDEYESDTSWETMSISSQEPVDDEDETFSWKFQETNVYSNYVLGEIAFLQKEYKKALELGLDFEWYLENSWLFDIEQPKTMYIEDDVFPHLKNLFVSNHKGTTQNKRVGKRVSTKTDTHFTTVFVVVF